VTREPEAGHRLPGRLPAALDTGRAAVPNSPVAVATALLRHRVPAAFAPPLAVLLARREP
jgi:hypothetical protein